MTEKPTAAAAQPPDNLSRLPETIPPDCVLVHNRVRPTRVLGARGFHAWVQGADDTLLACGCGWAAELGQHYRRGAPA
ncbi:MAG: hypothetical protein HIU82_13875 [Proteobacteria bacterium]|nr:hypothetical protein [Pseudomonadota bacterium]